MRYNVDEEVYFTDPQDDIMSGYYFIKKVLQRNKYLIMNSLCIREVSGNTLRE